MGKMNVEVAYNPKIKTVSDV